MTTPPAATTPDSAGSRRDALTAGLISFLGALALPLTIILVTPPRGRAAWDAFAYHERFIRDLITTWPSPDLSNPLTATTPGYHMLLALIARLGFESPTQLRIVSAVIGAVLIALLSATIAKSRGALMGVVLALPMVCSIYVLSSSAHILPDNLGWIGVLVILILAHCSTWNIRRLVLCAAVLALLVFVRQIHVWVAGVVWCAAFVRAHPGVAVTQKLGSRIGWGVLALVLTVPAFGVVWWFVNHWDGLTPPRFQNDMSGANPATPAFILFQFALLSAAFAPMGWSVLRARWRDSRPALVGAFLIGLVVSVVVATSADPDAGRSTGWWAIVGAGPVVMDRSVVILAMAPIGAVIVGALCAGLDKHRGWVALSAVCGFVAAQSATHHSWSRYHEPFILMFVALLLGWARIEYSKRTIALTRITLVLVSIALLGIALKDLVRGKVVEPGAVPPPRHTMEGDPWIDAHGSDKDPSPSAPGSEQDPMINEDPDDPDG